MGATTSAVPQDRGHGAGTAAGRRGLLLLVDGHALVHRAYHAIPASFMTSRGEPTNAVYGFTSMLLKVFDELRPDYCAVAFDRSGPTFRHLASVDYKATRPRLADDLRHQFQRVREVVQALALPIYEQDGYEADDVLGCLAQQAEAAGMETVIVTGDMDTLQLVNEHVRVMAPRGRIAETAMYDVAAVHERYGLEPAQVPDLKALAGDPSDNIKGVPGIGAKTASKLLAEFGTVEGLYARLDAVAPKWRDLLAAHETLVRGNKRLATIDRQVPCVLDLEQARFGEFDRAKALALFQELEFRTLLDRLPAPPAATQSAGEATDGAAGAPDVPARRDGAAGRDGAPAVPVTEIAALEACLRAVRQAGGFVVHPVLVQRTIVDLDLVGVALAAPERAPDTADGVPSWQAWYIPVTAPAGAPGDGKVSAQGALPEATVLDRLRPLLEDEALPKTAHNAKAVVTLLAERGLTLRGLRFDTMVAGYLLNPSNRAATVRDLVFQQMGREIAGTASLIPRGGSLFDVPAEQLAPEAVLEAQLVGRLAGELEEHLRERAQLELFERVELPLIPVLSAMERAGVKVDVQILGAMARELTGQIREVELAIYNDVGHQFTINSPQQLAKVLVEELHLPLTKRTKTGYSTDASVLEELSGTHPVIEHVLTYRQLTKLKSTYIDALPALINPRTGRLHTTFNQVIAATGRLSSDSPNLQNIPVRSELGRLIRRAFVAGEPQTVLLAADYAQIELRIAAHITRDPLLIEAFRNDEDIHAATAATVFNVPLEKVTAEQRRLAKTTNFAVLYGISDFGLSQRVGIARSEAAPFIRAYLDKYAGIRRYIEETVRTARQRGYVETPLGRRRYIPELRAQNAAVRAAGERMAINMPIQGAQADLIKLAMAAIFRELEHRGWRTRMLLQVHDELVFEVPGDELPEVARVVRERMEGAMELIVPIKVEMKTGENWYDMSPFHP
jgi:DNA polymerase-1